MEGTEQNPDQEIKIQEVITIIWKKKISIALITLIITSIAIVYAFTASEVYTSIAQFVTKTGSSGTNQNLSGLASLAGISIGNQASVNPADYLDKIAQDEEFLSPIIEKKWFYNGDSLYLHQIVKMKPDTGLPNWQYVFRLHNIEMLRNGMVSVTKEKAGALKTTGVLSLTVNMPSAQLAYDVNKFTIGLISDYLRTSMTSQAKEKRVFIQQRIAETKPILEASENALAKFKERNLAGSSPDLMLTEMRLTRDLNINQELYLQYRKQFELACIDEKNDQTLLQVLKNPEIPIVKSKPKKKMIIAGGMVGGIIVSFLFIFMFEWFKKKGLVVFSI